MTPRFSDLTSLDTGLRLLFVKVPTFWRVPFWLWRVPFWLWRVPFSSGFEINPHFNTMISSWSLGHHMQQITHENTRKLFGKTRGTQFTHESFVIEKSGKACVNTKRWCGECHDHSDPDFTSTFHACIASWIRLRQQLKIYFFFTCHFKSYRPRFFCTFDSNFVAAKYREVC